MKYIEVVINGNLDLGLLMILGCAFESIIRLSDFGDMGKTLASPLELLRSHRLTPHGWRIGRRWDHLVLGNGSIRADAR